jgi:hypothetical protein
MTILGALMSLRWPLGRERDELVYREPRQIDDL